MGFSPDGTLRTSHLLDLSLDLPLVIEFYDLPERVDSVINQLQIHMVLSYIVSWPVLAISESLSVCQYMRLTIWMMRATGGWTI
ncbi:MAG: DUF190 domain-containing protein [Methylobacter sp.]|nr:DUF190 domain-containing protein [Methylobacter sp.]